MRRKIRILLLFFSLVYIISPFDFPGPLDDLIVALFTGLVEWLLKSPKKIDQTKGEVEEGKIVS